MKSNKFYNQTQQKVKNLTFGFQKLKKGHKLCYPSGPKFIKSRIKSYIYIYIYIYIQCHKNVIQLIWPFKIKCNFKIVFYHNLLIIYFFFNNIEL